MNNALRITVIVFVLILLVFLGGNIFKKQNTNKIILIQTEMKSYDDKIAALDRVMDQNQDMKKELEQVRQEVKKYDKYALEYDSPPVTFDYLIKLAKLIKGELNFNFTTSGQKTEKEQIVNSYLIKGTSKFSDVYKFINHLERQQPLYYLHNLAISAPEITVSDTINYSFMLSSVSKQLTPKKVEIKTKSIAHSKSVRDLFTCDILVAKQAANRARKIRNVGLFDTDGIQLVAIIGQDAFFRDSNGIFQTLSTGDPVMYGSVASIDQIKGKVTFILDRGNGKKEKEYLIESGVKK